MIGKIIAFAGIHSSGKTTGVLEMVTALKKKGVNAWPIMDVARTVHLPINEKGTWLTQEVIAHRMAVQLLEAAAKHEVVITDRTLLDCLAYNLASGCDEASDDHQRIKRMVYDFTRAHNSTIFQLVEGFDIHKDGIRSHDEEFYKKSFFYFNHVYTVAEEDMPHLNIQRVKQFKDESVRSSILTNILKEVKG